MPGIDYHKPQTLFWGLGLISVFAMFAVCRGLSLNLLNKRSLVLGRLRACMFATAVLSHIFLIIAVRQGTLYATCMCLKECDVLLCCMRVEKIILKLSERGEQ